MRITLAIALIFSSLFLFGQVVDSTSLKTVDSLVQVSRALTNNGDFEQALTVNAVAEQLALEKIGYETAAYGNTRHNHGRILQISGALPEAEKWYLEALSIREKVLGKEHPDYAATLNNLAGLYLNLANYSKSEQLFLESKAIKEKVLGKQHKDYAVTLYNLGLLNYLMGNYPKAEPYYLEAKSIREKVLGKEHPDYLATLNNLAALYKELGNYKESELLYLELQTLRENLLGKVHPDYARVLSSLASLYSAMNEYEKSEPLFFEAKSIWEKTDQQDQPDYTGTLNNLGVLYMETGNYEKAEAIYLETIVLREKLLGKEDPEYAWSLNNLANLYQHIGNTNKAEPLYLEAQAIREKAYGKEHPDYAAGLESLANIYNDAGNYEKAERLFLEATAIDEKLLGKENPNYALCLYNLGNLYLNKGDYEKAEIFYLESKTIREKITGKEHSFYAWSLHNLALLYWHKGQYERAEPLLLEAQAIREKVLGRAHYDYSVGLDNLIKLYWSLGKTEVAQRYLLQADIAEKNLLLKGTTHLSAYELAAYTHKFETSLSRDFSFAHQAIGISAPCYDNILFYKGFLLNAASQINQLALSDTTSHEQFNLLKSYERRLATEYTKPLAEQKNVAALKEETNTLEKELTRKVAGFGEALRQVRWQEVQQSLQPGEAAIEFVHYKFIHPQITDSTMYAALVVTKEAKEPFFIPLFEEKQLDILLQQQGNSQAETTITLYNLSKEPSLYALIWKPLEQTLGKTRTIYFSPSGRLHRLNLGAITIPSQGIAQTVPEVLAERYHLVELGSTRQLVIPSGQKTQALTALLFGGIQYEMDSMTIYNANKNSVAEAFTSRRGVDFANADTTLRAGNWNYLKWTDVEISTTEALLSDAGFRPSVLRGFAATEESFKTIGNGTPSPRILHIATHGFFFPDPKSVVNSQRPIVNAEPVFKISNSPMIRSGLILAGGNYAWKTGRPFRPGMEDGILTAYEISQMNLSNTELVVLSACETGLGDIQGNEGVYGLQRAFKIAGAKYLIMSLWQVPDFQTQELMTTFYSRWIEDKMTVPEAFRTAQKTMREKYKDPFLWAGFVLVE